MPQDKTYLAADLGAGSGRVMAGHFDGTNLRLEEVSRFGNHPVPIKGSIHWDITGLYRNIVHGFAKGMGKWGSQVISGGIDTWGVDFGLIDAEGSTLGIPYAYRDSRTNGMVEKVAKRVSPDQLYSQTGIQTLIFNTIFQLAAAQDQTPTGLKAAAQLLFIPDLLNYWLTGVGVNERTIASTSQLYDPRKKDWAHGLINQLGLPDQIFGEIVDPGVKLGAAKIDGGELNIVTVGSHDTASAVAAVPFRNGDAAYLSSGTWSLLGVESDEPILTEAARAANFTNEIGVGNKVRFLKNITGLWLIQECRANWSKSADYDSGFEQMTREAMEAPAFKRFLDPDSSEFVAPGNMPERIEKYFQQTNQSAPCGRGEITRAIFESLALKYAVVMETMETIIGRQVSELNVVGGGCRDELLNQFTANALQRPVIAGPAEATATGNVLAQMIASGDIASLDEGRELVRRSFSTTVYEPQEASRWADTLSQYKEFIRK